MVRYSTKAVPIHDNRVCSTNARNCATVIRTAGDVVVRQFDDVLGLFIVSR